MNKSKRLKILLERGYFPEELPPPFVTGTLAKFRKSIFDEWNALGGDAPRTKFEVFSYPRLGRQRRNLGIVNPISQLLLSRFIAEHWIEISRFLNSSKISLDSPNFNEDSERAIPKPDFGLISLKRLSVGASFDHILVSDISRFYGTIYTHILPWSMHGKAWCKDNLHSATLRASTGNQLDVLVRKGQDNLTMGIPIGPDTSRIIAEIVAIGIERQFETETGLGEDRVFRFVDDFFIGYDAAGEAEDAAAHLASSCSQFELELNNEKTKVVDASTPTEELWPSELKQLRIRAGVRGQASDLVHFFTKAFHLAAEQPSENILLFALKTARSFSIHSENYALFENYVLRAARASSIVLPMAVQILINHRRLGNEISQQKVRKLICDTLKSYAPTARHAEIAWVLFLAKGLRISIPAESIAPILRIESSVCALLVLDLRQIGLIDGVIDTTFWESFMTTEALRTPMWLLAYEAEVKGWLYVPTSHIDGDPYFSALKRRNIFFYDEQRNVPTFERSRRISFTRARRNLQTAMFYNLVAATRYH